VAQRGVKKLRLENFSDRELLYLLVDMADNEGWASAQDIVEMPELRALDYPEPRRAVALRLSWLTRYGILEREHLRDEDGNFIYIAGDESRPKLGQRWRLTELGVAFVNRGSLTQRQLTSLEGMDTARMWDVARVLTGRARGGSFGERKLIERELRYGLSKERY
jgi:hypothetical protein